MTAHGKHLSRPADIEPESTPDGKHTHRQPRIILMGLLAAVIVLLLTNGLTLVYGLSVNERISRLEEFVAGKGTQRDAENRRLQQDISDAVCNVMDSLPAGGLFDPIREQYGCGPGIPVDQLDPEAAQNIAEIIEQGQAAPAVAVPPSEPTEAAPTPSGIAPPAGAVITPPAGPSAAPSQQSQPSPTQAPAAPAPVTPAPTAAAPTTPAPIADLSGVTDAVCGLLRVCA